MTDCRRKVSRRQAKDKLAGFRRRSEDGGASNPDILPLLEDLAENASPSEAYLATKVASAQSVWAAPYVTEVEKAQRGRSEGGKARARRYAPRNEEITRRAKEFRQQYPKKPKEFIYDKVRDSIHQDLAKAEAGDDTLDDTLDVELLRLCKVETSTIKKVAASVI